MWSNNLLFSPDSEKVVFIDFQMIGPSHPARDLWYLLTVNTDRVSMNEQVEMSPGPLQSSLLSGFSNQLS